ncbi:MAG TPA: MFS transporter, partial [Microvirga sp.]|nr:MFS transporter [Microvirga sp.]
SAGLFQIPMTVEYGWGRDVFSLAIALQNLLWGVGQPFAGAVADRFGAFRVLCGGALLYAAGLVVMAYATSPGLMHLGAGFLIGFGLSGCSFNLVLGAFSKLLPEQWRPMAFGAGTAAGSFGQFLFPPIGNVLIDSLGWHQALVVFAGTVLLVMPLALALATRPGAAGASGPAALPNQSIRQALSEAFQHRSYVLLVLGFFTCGFQLAFITAHLPAYLKDAGLSAAIGGWTLAVIGLANAFGSLASGWLSTRMSKRWLLAWIYFGRSIAIAVFILLPASPVTAIAFGISIGLLWLSTVPPTSSLVMLMFGTRYMAMLYGFTFFSHQVGGFLGVWLGGRLYEAYGSYAAVWWLSIALGIASALINLPIKEQPVERGPALQPAE